MVDESRVLSLLRTLVSTNSENPPGREAEVADILREHMADYGMTCWSVGPRERPSLIFSTGDEVSGPLVLHGHMDTVPAGPTDQWGHDPFSGEVVGGRVYGRGACDMKGPLSALAEAMVIYASEGHGVPLLMLATSDEESGCSGAEAVVASGLLSGVRYGICAEPTGLAVLLGEKGMLWSRVVASGKAAHASRPEDGVNAIGLCMEALRVLTGEQYPYEPVPSFGLPTVSIGLIRGGVKVNVVPDQCEAYIDMRLVPGQSAESVLRMMRERIADAGFSDRVRVEYVHGKRAVQTPPDTEIVRVTTEAVRSVTGECPPLQAAPYGTDCSVLQPKGGILNVICGPGSIEQAHRPDEYISIRQLMQSVDVYLRAARAIAASVQSGH